MVLRLNWKEAAYGVVSTVYIREEQSATINNKLYLDILTGIYYCRNKRNIYKKKKKDSLSLLQSLSKRTSYSFGSIIFFNLGIFMHYFDQFRYIASVQYT